MHSFLHDTDPLLPIGSFYQLCNSDLQLYGRYGSELRDLWLEGEAREEVAGTIRNLLSGACINVHDSQNYLGCMIKIFWLSLKSKLLNNTLKDTHHHQQSHLSLRFVQTTHTNHLISHVSLRQLIDTSVHLLSTAWFFCKVHVML